jgi:hypothetical protein
MTVFEDVAVRLAPIPLKVIVGTYGKAGVMFASVKVALKLPRATGLN